MAALPSEPGQENSEPLKYKTWVLKVSIHCEGCKRKVKKILHSVEGVYMIDVDTRQHKVVVTGNVDANTLLRKLEKSGKHAELWPDSQKNPTKNEQQMNEQQQQQQQQQQHQENQNQNPNVEQQQRNSGEPQKGVDNSAQQPQQQQQAQVKEVRFQENIPVAGDSPKPPGNNSVTGGGAKKKKKKKKGQNGNNTPNPNNNNNNNNNNGGSNSNGEVVAGVVTEQVGSNGGPQPTEPQPTPPGPNPGPDSMGPARKPLNSRVYECPPTSYYAPAPPPVYAVSYNTAYPSSSYSSAYYSAPAPYSYAYVHQGGDVEAPAPLDWNPHAVPPSDTFEMFSDENPNACSVM